MDLAGTCAAVAAELRGDPRYAHTSHLRVVVRGVVRYDAHFHGPALADIFSVTKSVLATLCGIALRQGRLPGLDLPVEHALPLRGTPAEGQTVRHLLTMTRGAETDGPYEIDQVMALPRGWLDRVVAAPRTAAPGTAFGVRRRCRPPARRGAHAAGR
ncbi:MAG TPA: serine hydrolase [Pilimelia sp.]|nr:serine hydrolase [Pilimelia sp.]